MPTNDVISAVATAGGSTAMLAFLGKYFLTKILKQHEETTEKMAALKEDFGIYKAVTPSELVEKLRERIVTLENKVCAAWVKLDDNKEEVRQRDAKISFLESELTKIKTKIEMSGKG